MNSEEISCIKNESLIRLTSIDPEELEDKGLHLEVLTAHVDDTFEALENCIELERDDINALVQMIEIALTDQTDFIEKFRKCIYGLNDENTLRNSRL